MCNIKYTEKEMAEAINDLIYELEMAEDIMNELYSVFNDKKTVWSDALNTLQEKHPVINEIAEFGPDGPAGIGLGNYGSHSL